VKEIFLTRMVIDWHSVPAKQTMQRIVAQLTSRVFIGEEICRNPEWLEITTNYAMDGIKAGQTLSMWPKILRPIMAKWLPAVRMFRQQLQKAREIILPVIRKRKEAKAVAIEEGKSPKKFFDALEWLEERARDDPYDPAVAQLTLSLATTHNTVDMMTQLLFDLCGRQELTQELRKEIVSVLGEGGLNRSTLYKLKLLDSVMKESQRLKPTTCGE
jgi:hypothetical protein